MLYSWIPTMIYYESNIIEILAFLCEIIPNNVQGGTELHVYLLLRYPISDKVISDVDIS